MDSQGQAAAIIQPSSSKENCLNCDTIRAGPYCQICGQHAHESHRSIRRLAGEGLRSATESDGPLLRTLRRLAFDPGGLTRDYLAGKRASQLSPVRLFLFALALFLIIAEHNVVVVMGNPTPAQLAAFPRWFASFARFVDGHGVTFLHAMHRSAELFAFLTVPIAALLLKLIYLNRPALTLYDHAVFAGYSLAFQLVMIAIIIIIPDPISWLGWLPFIAMCTHLFAQLRGVYGGKAVKIVPRMAALGVFSFLAFTVLFICWLLAAAALLAV